MSNTFKCIRNTLVILLLLASMGYAQEYTTEQIVNAIYKAEGGNKTAYPYGIKSLRYEDRTDRSLSRHDWAKWICTNTVNNNKKRYNAYKGDMDFIEFLGSRYCPVSEHKLNKNWVSNVKWFLNKGGDK